MKKWIIIVLVVLFFSILFFIWRIDEQYLGEDYYYLPKYEAIDIGYPGGAVIYKSKQKNVFSDVKIHADVISVNNNKEFIIALQKIDSTNIEKTNPNILDKDSLLYFIIVKKSDLVYGPFSKMEYLKKREELKISKKLVFKKE